MREEKENFHRSPITTPSCTYEAIKKEDVVTLPSDWLCQ
jgi:hypothetical protein